MSYINHTFTTEETAYLNTIAPNYHPYNRMCDLSNMFDYYRPSIKKNILKFCEYLEQKNINVYTDSMKWFLILSPGDRTSNIFELFAASIELGKIDTVKSIEQNNLLENVFNTPIKLNAETTYKNKLIILKELIRSDIKKVDLLSDFLQDYDKNYNFDVPMKKRLETYINTLPINLNLYPQLTGIYAQLHEEVYFTSKQQHIYNFMIDSNVIANTYKRSTKDVQSSLNEAVSNIFQILLAGDVFNETPNFKFVKYKREVELTTKIDADFVVDNSESYEILSKTLDLVIPELITGIINKKPYETVGDIKLLIKRLFLFDKLDNEIPQKKEVIKKLKI